VQCLGELAPVLEPGVEDLLGTQSRHGATFADGTDSEQRVSGSHMTVSKANELF
jgi:hypothetical protein